MIVHLPCYNKHSIHLIPSAQTPYHLDINFTPSHNTPLRKYYIVTMAEEEDPLGLPTIDDLDLDLDPANLPKYTDPFVQQYLSGRAALLEQEASKRSDASFRASLSSLAVEACRIVSRIRTHERQTLWSFSAEGDDHVFPDMVHSLAQPLIEKSELWKIVRRLPKGALLHCHMDAMIDIPWLIEQARGVEGRGFWASEPLTNVEALERAEIGFRFGGTQFGKSESLTPFNNDYVPTSLVPVTIAASTFLSSEAYPSFSAWLLSRMTITPTEALARHEGLNAIWKKFTSTFPIINSLLLYEPIFRPALRRLFADLAADNLSWADLRITFMYPYFRANSTTPEPDHVAFFDAFDEELADFQATPAGKNFWGARFIWTAWRGLSSAPLMADMARCLQHKVLFPHLISAFDLVGQEDPGRTLLSLLPELFWFRKACATTGFEIPFVFHAGECLGSGDATAQNMYDAVLLGTRRLGHAFALHKHPLLAQTVKSKRICVESCPISNEVLRLTASVAAHPLPALLAAGVPCVLANDDPAILSGGGASGPGERCNGVSPDFWACLQSWEDLGLAGAGSLAENSVRWALFEDQSAKDWNKDVAVGQQGDGVRGKRMREWRKNWEAFCEEIVIEYAVDWGGESEEEGEEGTSGADATA